MANLKQLSSQALELMKEGAVIITAVEIEKGIMQRAQVYFADAEDGHVLAVGDAGKAVAQAVESQLGQLLLPNKGAEP